MKAASKKRSLPFWLLIMICALGMATCKEPLTPTAVFKSKPKPQRNPALIIQLQPYTDLDKAQIDFVCSELKKIFPAVQVNKPIGLPAMAYYAPRNRYKADSLIKLLKDKTPDGQVTIGLTGQDISSTKGDVPDFGIMGLAYRPGKSCIASAYRLKKRNLQVELFKVSVHESGHTQGLPHCPVATCFMRDAEGRNHLNEETGFCKNCKAVLVDKGWKM